MVQKKQMSCFVFLRGSLILSSELHKDMFTKIKTKHPCCIKWVTHYQI
jgi:hypothetical protein